MISFEELSEPFQLALWFAGDAPDLGRGEQTPAVAQAVGEPWLKRRSEWGLVTREQVEDLESAHGRGGCSPGAGESRKAAITT